MFLLLLPFLYRAWLSRKVKTSLTFWMKISSIWGALSSSSLISYAERGIFRITSQYLSKISAIGVVYAVKQTSGFLNFFSLTLWLVFGFDSSQPTVPILMRIIFIRIWSTDIRCPVFAGANKVPVIVCILFIQK